MSEPARIDGGEPEGLVDLAEDLDVHASLKLLCKDIGDYLERTYSGWLWAIQPDEHGGVIFIRSFRLHSQLGWMIRLAEIQNDPHLSMARKAAGELLERFGMPREPFRLAQDAYGAAQRDPFGELIPDLQDKTPRERAGNRARAIRKAVKEGKARLLEYGGRTIAIVKRADIS